MKKVFSCLYGSALYGTSTPLSDRDIKHIVLPSLSSLLLGKKVVNVVNKTNDVINVRNTQSDIDEEFIPIQIFARDFMLGQAYALELAFAIDGNHAEQTFYDCNGTSYPSGDNTLFVEFVEELRQKFLTSNIKAMMGYVVNQANMYSFKGERLNVAREFLAILEDNIVSAHEEKEPLIDFVGDATNAPRFQALQAKYPKYFNVTRYDIGDGRMRPCFVLLEKTFPHTSTLGYSIDVAKTIIKKYGARADAASESNVDWKATMHAIRIVDEGLKILTEHKLEFPLAPEYAHYLLSVRRGEQPIDPIRLQLAAKLDELKTMEQQTTLPSMSDEMKIEFDTFMVKWLMVFYDLEPEQVHVTNGS